MLLLKALHNEESTYNNYDKELVLTPPLFISPAGEETAAPGKLPW